MSLFYCLLLLLLYWLMASFVERFIVEILEILINYVKNMIIVIISLLFFVCLNT